MALETNPRTGFTEPEAQEIHKHVITGFLVFTGIAIGAHVLVWMWRPWFPGKDGYSMMDITQAVSQTLFT